MAFGQVSGPPATAAQVQQLAELFAQVGFESFREARHPYGLTQRQAGGKFTRGEADELIERLSAEVEGAAGDAGAVPDARPAADDVVLAFPDEMLADELTRRGWTCTPPPS